MESFPREPMHPWLRTNREHILNVSSMRNYASQVSLVDDGVGEILKTLADLQLDQDTLIVFIGDQGMAGGHGGFWGMGDHTRPRTLYDWTLHIPLIVRHPGKVAEGATIDRLVSNYDLLPSLLSHIGLQEEIPDDPRGPGRNFAPLLQRRELQEIDWEDAVFAEYGPWMRMVRTKRWKFIARADEERSQMFDLMADPAEKNNLHGDPEYADVQLSLVRRLDAFFATYSTPQWNMWSPGGTSKHLHAKKRPAAP